MEKAFTVNKIGGANMSKLDEVHHLVTVLQEKGESPLLVVSAFQGVTDQLSAVLDNLDGTDFNNETITAALQNVRGTVFGKIEEFIASEEMKQAAMDHVQREIEIMIETLLTHKKVTSILAPGEKTYSVRDKVIAFGERSVIGVLEAFLKEKGIAAMALNDVTYGGNGEHVQDGKISKRRLHEGIQRGIAESLRPHGDTLEETVVIIGGHVKDVLRGMVPEIGRSYTDTTAVDVTVALERQLGIPVAATVAWKAVDGVLSADPRQIDPALNRPKVQPDVSYDEAMELAGSGSLLMQMDALSRARDERIPLSLKNIDKPFEEGTTFTEGATKTNAPFKMVMANENVDVLSCKIPEMAIEAGFIAELTHLFEEEGISINDVLTSSTVVSFTVNLPKDKADQEVLRAKIRKIRGKMSSIDVDGELYDCYTQWDKGLSNVVIIGEELKDKQGVLSTISGVFSAEGVNVEGITQTPGQRKVSFYVSQRDAFKAVQALHRLFIDKDKIYAQKIKTRMNEITEGFLT